MAQINKSEQRFNTVLGALTADAASLGTHWIYDQQRIYDLTPVSPEFHSPNKTDYEGVLSYFAHDRKRVGDLSHYGEQTLLLLRALINNKGLYNKAQYQDLFAQHFGYGGDYIGYIDRPTRDTLDNLATVQRQTTTQANLITFDGSDEHKQTIHSLVTDIVKQDKAYASLNTSGIDKQHIPYALDLLNTLKPLNAYHGADDEQLPAISKLPSLVAIYAGNNDLNILTESAVRVTNDNNRAVAFGLVASKMIEAAILTRNIPSIIDAARQAATPEIRDLIDQTIQLKKMSTIEATKHIGMSCQLEFGIPSVIHNLTQQTSFVDAVRQNIYAGGDTCGRAILLGAVLGNVYGIGDDKGIPQNWVDKLNQKEQITALLNTH